jgi:DNA-binding transcriptional MocR family regulator
MADTCARLKAIGIAPWIEPQAGMFVWCHLPGGVDAAEVTRRALAAGVVLAPGNVFSLSGAASGFQRFNVAQSSDERILKILEDAMTNCGARSTGSSTSDRDR